jgi:hypothetical protein
MPKLWTGGFADVYRLRRGSEWVAVKCFKRSPADVRERYAAISDGLAESGLTYFVDFRFLPEEMLVNGARYPVVKMRWADGIPLHEYVRAQLGVPGELRALAARLVEMVRALEERGLAHGDFQHGNILVGDGGLTLVDYDGMYVGAFEGGEAPEIGLPNYQHPRRMASHYGPGIDRFPLLVLCAGLHALAADPSLWNRFNPVDTESFLFTRDDFLFANESPLVAHVRSLGDRRACAWLDELLAACEAEPDATPFPDALPDFVGDAEGYVPEWARDDRTGEAPSVPWWVSMQESPSTYAALVPAPPPALEPASDTRPMLQFEEVPSGASLPIGRFVAVAGALVVLLPLLTGLIIPGATIFFVLVVGMLVAFSRWSSLMRIHPPARFAVAFFFVLLLWNVIPVHLFIALLVTAGSVLADRYSKWKTSASSRYGQLTSRFANLVSMVQSVDAERSAAEREILALNRAEVNEKNSTLLYLRRRAEETGTPAPSALPPDLDRAVTQRYQASRQTHTASLARLTRSLSDLHEEQRLIAAELDTLQPPGFLDFLSARPASRN